MMKNNHTALYGSLILLQCLIWGVGNAVTKIALETVPPFCFLVIRFGLALLLMVVFFRKRLLSEYKREHLKDAVVIGLFTAATFIFATLALLLTTATIAGFLIALTVVFTPVLSFFLLRERFDKRLLPILGVVVAGMYALCGNTGVFSFGWGELLSLLTAITGAAMLTYTSRHVGDIGPFILSSVQMAVTALASLPFALLLEDVGKMGHTPLSGWMSLLYTSVGCTCIAYVLQNIALRKLSATFVALAFCSEPVFTAVAAYFFLGETLSLQGLVGCGLIIVGLVPAALLSTPDEDREGETQAQEENQAEKQTQEKTQAEKQTQEKTQAEKQTQEEAQAEK